MRTPAVVIAPIICVVGACTASDDIPAPRVSSVSPASATPGALVTVNGAYLCQQPETGNEDPLACDQVAGVVYFDEAPGVATLWTDSAIMVEVPSVAAGSVDVSVTVTGRSSDSVSFSID